MAANNEKDAMTAEKNTDVLVPADGISDQLQMTRDEYHLATLGYKQVFTRGLGLFENWVATFQTMNFVSGLPVLFGFAMYTGGPQAALSNWTMVGGFSLIVSLSLAELAAALPTAGGIYYWSYVLGGPKWGPFLSWMTAWWNWAGWITVVPAVQQGSTNFLLSALAIQYPDAEILTKGWFSWILTSLGVGLATIPNIWNQTVLKWTLRGTFVSFLTLFCIYWIWIPYATRGRFRDASILTTFYNGINESDPPQASNSYCWVVGILFGAWEFYGYDTSVHVSEETQHASVNVARGMWLGTLATWCLSVPTLILFLLCIQDLEGIINGGFANNFAEFLIQTVGRKGATAILVLCFIDSTCACTACVVSAQRVTYAIARDHILPGSKWLTKVSKSRMPVNAALLVLFLSICIEAAIIGSVVAFSALTATGTIAVNVSYAIPIIARHTVGKKIFKSAKWNLGKLSTPLAVIASLYILFLFVVLILPQLFPVTPVS